MPQSSQFIFVKNVYPHPKYNGGANHFHHDVGILELNGEIPRTVNSQPVTLIHSQEDVPVGRDGYVSGWGTNPDNPNDSRLYQVHLTVISAQSCHDQIGGDTVEERAQHEICGQADGKNFCEGDSGGPFIDSVTGRQIGVVSYGVTDCTKPYPSIFASVKDNLKFIRNTMNTIVNSNNRFG